MPKISAFQKYVDQYEMWFTKYRWVYEAELRAVKALLPQKGVGVEVGVGTGRFAAPLGIKLGVEPSPRTKKIAQKRGIQVFDGVAEKLPFDDHQIHFVLMVTTAGFVDDLTKAFQEANRILSQGGFLIVGEVDRNSPIGEFYLKRQNEKVFYKEAFFYLSMRSLKLWSNQGLKILFSGRPFFTI